MLSVTLTYEEVLDVETILLETNLVKSTKAYVLKTKEGSVLLEAIPKSDEQCVSFSFSGNLTMAQYQTIHDTITAISDQLHAVIDDQEAFMGYLENYEKAYLITNWEKWVYFLNGAKHTSMEGQKVRIYNEQNFQIAEGILVHYEKDEAKKDTFTVTSCSLITTFGERTFTGGNLRIEATGEFY
ncbi:hypothetical protein [Bacillus taeanensis]|uniref:Uncharacterized protein n=1 Tax=Bacillus taeanensis TaxID=273032 RepID=A0A366XWN7_9BACI|nr:hypothetical protein [Bacillus taeanensis]RBW68361.1 hypothetical protein DS031_16985 [Bacillus taeanensis]